jgi:hypothetical protein
VDGGFAIVGGRCTSRDDPPEADCNQYQPIVTFLTDDGHLRSTVYDSNSWFGVSFSVAGDGVVESQGPSVIGPDGFTRLPSGGGWECGMGDSGQVMVIRDRPSDPQRPEDTPGVLQPMIYEDGWHETGPPLPVGDERGRHVGDLPYCASRVVVIAGHIFTGPGGFRDFPRLTDDYRDTLVGRTATGELLQRRPTGLVLLAEDGTEHVLVDHPVDRAFLSSDGTRVTVWADRQLSVLNL